MILVPNLDYYLERGRMVLTQHYLKNRGKCCETGCRHCPYGFGEGRADPDLVRENYPEKFDGTNK